MSRTFPREDSQSPELSDEEEDDEQPLADEEEQLHGEDEDDGEDGGKSTYRFILFTQLQLYACFLRARLFAL
jgi:hypothetical protein